jgi:hypothetical protein
MGFYEVGRVGRGTCDQVVSKFLGVVVVLLVKLMLLWSC